jgi:hypothetical protein
MFAAANGHADAVRLLLLHGSNPLALDGKDQTAAELAAAAGHREIVSLLNDPKMAMAAARRPAGGAGTLPDSPRAAGPAEGSGAADAGPPGEVEVDPGAVAEATGAGAAVAAAGAGGLDTVERPPETPPPPRLQGSTLSGLRDGTTASVREEVRMKDFRESQLPIILEEVDEGGAARIRVLGGEARRSEVVPAGGEIGGTGLQLLKAERKVATGKMGDGHMLDVSQVTVVDTATGRRHRVVRNATASASQPAALISVGGSSDVYEVREGDEFSAGDSQPARYRVLDVRPTQVVVENLDTGETATLARSYGR